MRKAVARVKVDSEKRGPANRIINKIEFWIASPSEETGEEEEEEERARESPRIKVEHEEEGGGRGELFALLN